MKKLFMVVFAMCFMSVSMVYAADESNLPDSNRTDQFTVYQQTDDDDQVKALIGADRIPVVDNAELNNPQFVGERQDVEASLKIQQHNPSGARSPSAVAGPSINPTGPSAPVQP